MLGDDPTTDPPGVFSMFGRFIPWLQTLGIAVVGAFVVGALEVALALLTGGGGPDPWTIEGLRHLGRAGLAAAVVVAIAFLKQPPAGTRREWSEEERAAERARLQAQGRLLPPSTTGTGNTPGGGTPPAS